MPPDSDIDTWHPSIQALYRYWLGIHPETGLPGRQHVDPLDLRRFLPWIWLLELQREPFRARYRLVGTRICELAGRELTGMWLDEAHSLVAENPSRLDRFRRVAEIGQPSWRRGKPSLFLSDMADFTEIENLFLPLARNGQTVDMILAYSVFYHLDGTEL